MPGPTPDEKVDGRTQRAERSRRAAVEAMLDLIDEGAAGPTAQQVADRSGVSLSTIFRLYDDLDSLHVRAIQTQAARLAPLIVELDHEAPLGDRVEELMASRAKLYEAITPVRRFAKHLAPTSEAVAVNLAQFDAFLREQALDLFVAELSAPGAAPVAGELVDALTSWDLWERLRSTQSLSVHRARSTVTAGLLTTLDC